MKYLLSFIPSKFKNIIKYFQNLVLGTKSDIDSCFSQSWFRNGIYFLVCYSSITWHNPDTNIKNAKPSDQRFRPCHENRLIKTISMIQVKGWRFWGLGPVMKIQITAIATAHYLHASFKALLEHMGCRVHIVGIILMSPFSRQGQNLSWLSLAFKIDWRVVLLICLQ